MAGAVINHDKLARIKGRTQFIFNFLSDGHFFSVPPSILLPKV